MIVLYSWLFIIGALGLIVGFVMAIVRFAKSRKLLSRKSGVFMLGCFVVVLVGAIGALSSVSSPQVIAKEIDANPEKMIQVNSNEGTKPKDPETDQIVSQSENIELLAAENSLQKTIVDYMFENFGGSGDEKYSASWYRFIEAIQVKPEGESGYVITVDTTFFHDDEGKKFAKEIPPAFFGWANSKENIDNSLIWAVIVNDQNGKPLIRSDNPINPLLADE
ncbi:hypothetical protein [Paenibacillus dendritiformis]|uniref:hypothetical protein n=1 Tax=Paenibacillus dendritiformis TaxID=130049 RepID=UPI000DA7A74A|nr:hypothetical protein [Paenibacillus dendritiformis]PZM65927.1 hypothetical protein DOE73_09350 [Paenibacillus dendritiformis]